MCYTNDVKRDVLGVDESVLDTRGAVDEVVACEMASGVRELLGSDIAVSVTGIAGPGGEEPGKPVGTVWMGVSTANGAHATRYQFSGSREDVRMKTTRAALEALDEAISELSE